MSTLNKNISQAIQDFNSIQNAIIDKAVDVPEGTPTEEYGEKIREIETGITPTGILEIIENGNYDVTQYAEADVTVPQPTGKVTLTENGENINVAQYATADVNVETYEADFLGIINRSISGSVTIPAPPVEVGVITIGDYAFAGCHYITSISFEEVPDGGNNEVRSYAFFNCTGLTTLDLRGFKEIEYGAFNHSGITTLYFSTALTTFQNGGSGETVFSGASALTDIYYTGTQVQWEAITGLSGAGLSQDVTIHYEYTPS